MLEASGGTKRRSVETGSDEANDFEQQREEEAGERHRGRRKAERYRNDRAEPDLAGKTVVVVDGVAMSSLGDREADESIDEFLNAANFTWEPPSILGVR